MNLLLLLAITVALPIAWGVAEFKARPRLRRIFGVMALLWVYGVFGLAGAFFGTYRSNLVYTATTKDLLDTSVAQLKAGKTEAVLREWTRANAAFAPTYEDAYYRQIVDQAIAGMNGP